MPHHLRNEKIGQPCSAEPTRKCVSQIVDLKMVDFCELERLRPTSADLLEWPFRIAHVWKYMGRKSWPNQIPPSQQFSLAPSGYRDVPDPCSGFGFEHPNEVAHEVDVIPLQDKSFAIGSEASFQNQNSQRSDMGISNIEDAFLLVECNDVRFAADASFFQEVNLSKWATRPSPSRLKRVIRSLRSG